MPSAPLAPDNGTTVQRPLRLADVLTEPPCCSTSDTSTGKLPPALLWTIQQMMTAVIREQISTLVATRAVTPLNVSVRGCPLPRTVGRRRLGTTFTNPIGCPSPMAYLSGMLAERPPGHPVLDMGASSEEQQGVPFMKGVMLDELPANCRTPTIPEYNGTTDPQEHLLHFENATILH
ncbi:UNVERIFIED_CONTAM: hypothetical protein Slati_2537900 [Sesamum latifolium]|uniref:Uncharacterized protein n=1 Tax=Sesamum latifolium TaxID=2727402 RepID=A0AAW2WHI6_9LAMI